MTERAKYPTATSLLAWAVLNGPERDRDGCARELARRVLGEETDGPTRAARPTLTLVPLPASTSPGESESAEELSTERRHG